MSVFHVLGERVLRIVTTASVSSEIPEVRKEFVPNDRQHLFATAMLELRPPHVLLLRREEHARELLTLASVLIREPFFSHALPHVEQSGKHQERDLFDDGQRIGNPTRPELFPEFVNPAA